MLYKVQVIGSRAATIIDHICKLGCNAQIINMPEEISSETDICVASGIQYIISKKYLRLPRLGIWGFHESNLPKGKGCAPLQWTVLNGIDTLTVSFFELTERIDSGRLLGQESATMSRSMLLEDIRSLSVVLYKRLLDKYLIPFLEGKISPYPQRGQPGYYRKRTPKDSQIDISKPLQESWDLIRICDNDEFPAWFEIEGQKIIIKRYRDKQLPL